MKANDDSLDRLLRSAARAPESAPPALSPPLRRRILAEWRSQARDDEFAPILPMLRGAAIFAGILMIASATWKTVGDRHEAAGPLPLVRYAISMQLPP